MSTISLFEGHHSELLAKRFANLASTYFDSPDEARAPAARVPLENLFRMLQMFRYNAFSDERRNGILELEGFGQEIVASSVEESWHFEIENALNSALDEAFGKLPKEDALYEIQSTLSWLATNTNPPSKDASTRTRRFLERFAAALV